MTDADDTIPPAKTPPRRKRWLLPVALVLVGIIGLVFWISRIQARRLIIGETDPATGLKYGFTVGQGWKNNPTYKYQPGFAFKVPDRGAFQVWMENNILPRKISRPGFAV